MNLLPTQGSRQLDGELRLEKRLAAGQRNAAAGKLEQVALAKEPFDERRDVGFPTAKVARALRTTVDATSASDAVRTTRTIQRRVAKRFANAATQTSGTV